ncbi:uncharacterized protein BT62DRAFT_929452 [Guyanagaster necrorhizus]|uniref:Uncharacterized protein n=1 Tax=Guyanagaster necrorhizus TaxID=856835 RepID=A0A9P7VWR5_9AGAR|nr:uncharacterized protein BT62DRAFT_929452 [Guyanagaster necrorhizus MCA 3950]KAG7448374.1 hypothetical protein BT62DRAFT_929452 [Guyanagaster necrorhizus MCA 3950]
MDIARTDSPIQGFPTAPSPSPNPLVLPSPDWVRALAIQTPDHPDPDAPDDVLGIEAEADLVSLVHHLSFPSHWDDATAYSPTLSSRISTDSLLTIAHSPSSAASSSHTLVKTRSFASLRLSLNGKREAVYIVEDDDDDDDDGMDTVEDFTGGWAYSCEEELPPSRFSIDEDDYIPSPQPTSPISTRFSVRPIWPVRSRAVSFSTHPPPPPSMPPSLPPSPSALVLKKSKRKTTLSVLSNIHLGMFSF